MLIGQPFKEKQEASDFVAAYMLMVEAMVTGGFLSHSTVCCPTAFVVDEVN